MVELTDKDYQAIEDAVMETARGRWFLNEYKKRNGVADTSTLLDAISRLEKVIGSIHEPSKGEVKKPADDAETLVPVAVPIVTAHGHEPDAAPIDDVDAIAAAQAVIGGGAAAGTDNQPALTEENLQFFANDEELFSSDANDILPDPSAPAVVEEPEAPVEKGKPAVSITVMESKSEQDSPLEDQANERIQVFQTTPQEDVAAAPQTVDNPLPAVEFGLAETGTSDDAATDESTPDFTFDAPFAEAAQDMAPAEVEETNPVPDVAMQPDAAEQERIVVIRDTVENVDIPLFDDDPADEAAKANNS